MLKRSGCATHSHPAGRRDQMARTIGQGARFNVFSNDSSLLKESIQQSFSAKKKIHCFDLAAANEKIIVECKSHRWRAGARVPSAKMTVWNEAMYCAFATLHEKPSGPFWLPLCRA
jgi:hypothetical protein